MKSRPQIPFVVRRTLADRPIKRWEQAVWYLAGRISPRSLPESHPVRAWPGEEAVSASHPPLRVVIRSFREPDLIPQLVSHCYRQGAERVIVLDDQSGDGSVEVALAAGAEVHEAPPAIADREQRGLAWVMSVIEADRTEAWWLALDLDEFPVAPWGLTIAEFIRLMPADVDTVGAHAAEHFPPPQGPTTFEALVEGSAGPGARWVPQDHCSRAHFKHNLIRYRPHDVLRWGTSFHFLLPREDGRPIREAGIPLLLHHLRWRDLRVKRLLLEQMLADPRRTLPIKALQRANLRFIERGRLDLHAEPLTTFRRWGVELEPWQDLAYAWGFPGRAPRRPWRTAIWGGDAQWRERVLRVARERPDLEVSTPSRAPAPSRFDLVLVPAAGTADRINDLFRRTTDAGIWVMPDTWSHEGLSRLLAGAVMDASASAAAGIGNPLAELRFQLQRIPRDPVFLARKLRSRRGSEHRA